MMPCIKVFSEVIGKIFLARVPANVEMVSVDLVGNPEESHFHGSRPLFFDRVIGDTRGGLVVTMCRCGWLRMTEFLEYEA
jgi:hypothetical protein